MGELAMVSRFFQGRQFTRFSAEARLNDVAKSFNPRPAAQLDRRPAELFERRWVLIRDPKRSWRCLLAASPRGCLWGRLTRFSSRRG